MFALLKIVHLLSLAVAMGMTTANLVTGTYVKRLSADARPHFVGLGRSFGALGLMAVALLWLTGVAMLFLRYDLNILNAWFVAKLVFVIVLTGLAIRLRMIASKSAAAGSPPPAALMRTLMFGVLIAAVLTVISAVFAFG